MFVNTFGCQQHYRKTVKTCVYNSRKLRPLLKTTDAIEVKTGKLNFGKRVGLGVRVGAGRVRSTGWCG